MHSLALWAPNFSIKHALLELKKPRFGKQVNIYINKETFACELKSIRIIL